MMKAQAIWDPLIIGISLFVLIVVMVLFVVIWSQLGPKLNVANANLNATQKAVINGFGNGFFYNSLDILMVFIYAILILAAFISASYEGADTTSTLVLGLVFLVVAVIVSFGISDVAHSYLTQAALLPITKQYFSRSLYLMDNLPVLTGLFTIGYMIFVVTRKHISTGGGGGGMQVVQG